MIRMHIAIIKATIMKGTVGIITRTVISSGTKTANAAAVKASAAGTMANADIITPKVSAGTGTVIRIDVCVYCSVRKDCWRSMNLSELKHLPVAKLTK